MTPDVLFSLCNTVALACWIALIAGPRWRGVTLGLQWGAVTALSLVYAVLIAVFFFRVEGGGFFSLTAVQALFADPHVALAGWVHYLAFDLFVGLWIAARSDEAGINRLVQAPILVATFMFGPFGFLLFQAVRLGLTLPTANGRPMRARL